MATRSLPLHVEVFGGELFLQTDARTTRLEDAPVLGLFGSSTAFGAHAALFDLDEERDADGVRGWVKPFGRAVACSLPLAPHVGARLTDDPLVIPALISSQRCVSDNGYPIQKTLAHAINPPRLSQLEAGRGWRGTLVFIDMCGYQEVDFALHLGALRSVIEADGAIEDLWLHSSLYSGVSERSTHQKQLPFYVRGALDVCIHASTESLALPRLVQGETTQIERRRIEQWGAQLEEAPDALRTLQLLAADVPPELERTFATLAPSGAALQSAMSSYIVLASRPYELAGATEPQIGALKMFTPAWSKFVVPQYMSTTGIEMPASAMAMGLVFPPQHHTLETFFRYALEDVCDQLRLSERELVAVLEQVSAVYAKRRRTSFRLDVTRAARVSGTEAPAMLTHGALDVVTACVDTIFTETCTAMSYTTDRTGVPTTPGDDTRIGRILRKMAPSGVMEVERVTTDLLRCGGFDCEDGSMFNYRLHTLLCASRFVYQSEPVRAFARVMDLYMPCVAKMQCGGNPERDSGDSLVCHILSWLVLRDEAYRMMMDGSQYARQQRAGLFMAPPDARNAAARTAFMDPALYEGAVRTSELATPLEYRTVDTPHYPLPVMLCLEPTAPVVAAQMPCEAHYSDMGARALRDSRTRQVVHARRAKNALHDVPSAPPLLSAYPDPAPSVPQARRSPFDTNYSPFYRGVISLWMPDSAFLGAVQRQRGSRRPVATSARAQPVALDYVCAVVTARADGPDQVQLGAPHNLFVTHGSRAGTPLDSQRVVLIPTTPIAPAVCSLMARVVACEPCPESPQVVAEPRIPTKTLAAMCMPNVARLVSDEGMFVPSTDASGDARPPRRRAGVPELGDTASREPGTLSFKRAVASPLTPTLRSDSPLLRELDAQTERDITRCVRVCPADAHLFFEREIAAALEAALREKTIAAIEIHATRIGRPQFTRFRPLLPAQVTQAVCRVLEVDRDSALTYQRLSMLCGDSLRALLDADTTDPRREQLALALGVEHAEMLRPERHETLVRAVSQFILDCDHLTRFLIVLHMYEQR